VNKWRTASLGDLTNNFDAIRIPVKEADRQSGPYPYYGASGVVDYINKFIFDGEYLLIAEDGENLRTRNTPIAFIANGKFWVNNHAHIVSGNDKADTRFLLYSFLSLDISRYLTGSTMPKLTQGNLKNIPLLAPPLPEQRRIAHILGTLDDKIENNRKTAKTLEAMAQAIFQSWFVDFDPVRAKMAGESRESICKRLKLTPEILDLFPDRLVDSELGEIPEGWRVGTFEDYADIVGGSTPSTSNPDFWITGIHSWATPKDLANLKVPVLLSTEHRITETGLQQISSRLLPVGTVLLSSRAPIGYVAITETPVAINQGFIALKPYNLENNIFIMLLIKKQMEEIISRANGSTFLEISKAKFRPIPVIFPLEPVLIFFAALVRPYYSRIVSLEKLTQILTACRESLLPRLISGEIRLMENENILHHYEKMNQ